MPQPTPLDEAQNAHLIDRFYAKVSADRLFGAVFNPPVDDWDAHKRLLMSSWCSIVLLTGTYRGNPMALHRPHAIGGTHFERWLASWGETAREVLDAGSAALMVEYAGRIGQSLQLGMGLLTQPSRLRSFWIPAVSAPGADRGAWISVRRCLANLPLRH